MVFILLAGSWRQCGSFRKRKPQNLEVYVFRSSGLYSWFSVGGGVDVYVGI